MIRQDSDKYWSVKFSTMPYEVYAYGADPFTAISEARAELLTDAMDTTPLGGALVRPAVHKEWDFGTEHYTNGGDFIQDTSKPCRECGTPVPFHTHREELGFCQPCQSAYFNHTCDKCGRENVDNWDGNPFTRYCDECEANA
jgi:hypothetical protein